MAHVAACRAAEFALEHCQRVPELLLVGSDELGRLLLVEHEVELRDGGHLERLRCVSCLVCLDGAEDDVLVCICSSCSFKGRLESHAGWASRRPEIYDDSWVLLYDPL